MISTTLDPHAQIESRKKKSLFEEYMLCIVCFSCSFQPSEANQSISGWYFYRHAYTWYTDIHIIMYTYIHCTHIDKTLLYCMSFVSRLFDPCIHLDVHVPKSHLFGTLTGWKCCAASFWFSDFSPIWIREFRYSGIIYSENVSRLWMLVLLMDKTKRSTWYGCHN